MKGSIRCGNKFCKKPREQDVCPACGTSSCYINIYWRGKHYDFRKSTTDGIRLDFRRAIRQLEVMRHEMDTGKFNPADWLDSAVKERLLKNKALLWLDQKTKEAQRSELSFGTLKSYSGFVFNYYIPLLGAYDVKEVRLEQLQNFKDKLPDHLKIKTRKNILDGLHAFFLWLKRKGVIVDIPQFPEIKGDDAEVSKSLDREIQDKGLAKIPEVHRDILEFGFETGLRGGELTALKVKDINVKNRQALIQRTWTGSHLSETTKGRRKNVIPLSDRAVEIAKRHIQMKFKDIPDITLFEDFLFINSQTKRRYTTKKLNLVWQTYSETNTTYYEASRHSFCTQIVESGADSFTAQKLMRHATIQSTLKYFHPTEERIYELINRRGTTAYNESIKQKP